MDISTATFSQTPCFLLLANRARRRAFFIVEDVSNMARITTQPSSRRGKKTSAARGLGSDTPTANVSGECGDFTCSSCAGLFRARSLQVFSILFSKKKVTPCWE